MKVKALTGAEAAAEAMRQINPGVVAAYPITPQTSIVETFAQFVADGKVQTEFIPVESEHSAMSACIGAQAAGVRAMTASSSQGLALMFEMLGIASGLRLPILMHVATRALSAPINIHCDHSDVMGVRSQGWIQIFCENPQEVYDHTLIALKLAEHPLVQLPAMVIQDGFITSHCVEGVEVLEDEEVKKFVGEYIPRASLLEVQSSKLKTIGPLVLPDFQTKIKREQMEAMKKVGDLYEELGEEFSKLTGRDYRRVDTLHLRGVKDFDTAIVAMGSACGTVRQALSSRRPALGSKVGLLKINLLTAFPYSEVRRLLKDVKKVVVIDRTPVYGTEGPLCAEVKNSLYGVENPPEVKSVILGIGGRDIRPENIAKLLNG